MGLIQGVHQNDSRVAILRNTVRMCRDLDIEVIAEGIEDEADLEVVEDCGVYLVQGYLFAEPEFEAQPDWSLPAGGRLSAS